MLACVRGSSLLKNSEGTIKWRKWPMVVQVLCVSVILSSVSALDACVQLI